MGKQVKEIKHDSQGFGLLTWMNHDAIYQEEKDMRGGSPCEESKNQEFHCKCVQF